MRGVKGITLIELLVVMSIIGIVVLLAAPEFSTTMRKSRLKDCAQRLASDITQARAKAQAEGQRAMVVVTKDTPRDFNTDGDTEHYFIFIDANRDNAFNAGDTAVVEVVCDQRVLMETGTNPLPDTDCLSNGRCMRFSVLGTLLSGAADRNITMGYSGDLDNKARISVVSMTGKLRIQLSEDGGLTWKDLE